MNSNNYIKVCIPILLFIFCFSDLFADKSTQKGSPYVEKIILKDFGYYNNNHSIIQHPSGILFIGNSNGIISYNGIEFSLIAAINDPTLTKTSSDTIFYGGYNEIGFLNFSNPTKITTDTLITSNFGKVKKMICHDNKIYFLAENNIYRIHDGHSEKIYSSEMNIELFKPRNVPIVSIWGEGVYYIKNNKLIPLTNHPSSKFVLDIIDFNDGLLLKTRNSGFLKIINGETTHFYTDANEYIKENIFSCFLKISTHEIAIGTSLGGILVIDDHGNSQAVIDKSSGLYDSHVNKLFKDNQGNLWSLHNHGLSRIEYPSPFSYFNQNHGLRGNVSSVARYQNRLFVATSQGVFLLDPKSYPKNRNIISERFRKLDIINCPCYEFHIYENQLFVSAEDGIYKIINETPVLFYNREGGLVKTVLHSKHQPSKIFLGRTDGLSAVRYINGIIIVLGKLAGINEEIINISEDDDGTIWLVSRNNKIFQLIPDISFSEKTSWTAFESKNITENISWIRLYQYNGNTIFSTSQGIYHFNKKTSQFYKDTSSTFSPFGNGSWIYPIAQDISENVWINVISKDLTQQKIYVVQKNDQNKHLYKPLPLNRIKNFYLNTILPDYDDIIWFGGFEGLIRFDYKDPTQILPPPEPKISKVVLKRDSILFMNPLYNQQNYIPEITFNMNSLRIEFFLPDYRSEDYIEYQTKLAGYQDEWSTWNPIHFKEFTNLREGKYIFYYRAKSINGEISEVRQFEFKIVPPFYRTHLAYFIYVVGSVLFILLIIKWRNYYFAREKFKLENIINERTEEIVLQKEKADNLLERVLPKNTAKELKSGKKAGPYHYKMVTVLFSDIQGFTKISEQLESEKLIDELDKFFLKFDAVVEKYNIEKIKTIGDAYMCAGGIPEKNRTNPVEVILAAFEMQNFMKVLKDESPAENKDFWELRIGIDTGPVVAGVLGRSKISYDIWGGTVNTASRMEASGEAGKINITENTFMLIKEFFICKYRGKMPVKYKGEIDMYFVENFRPSLSKDIKGLHPNNKFFTQLQLLRLNDIEEFVLEKLEQGLPDTLYYHNVKHTIDVVTQVELIGRAEKVTDEEMLLLKTAAMFHDMGHLVDYDTHEEESINLAKKILPKYQYSDHEIDKICELIAVTKMPPEPTNHLEEIMCDADLDYLGRTDFVPVSYSLFREYYERNKIGSLLEWNKIQYDFIKKHHYFTQTARKLREVNKNKQLENIRKEINQRIIDNDEAYNSSSTK